MRKEENTIKTKKGKKEKMINKISAILLICILTSCASLKDKMPKRKACTGETGTLADVICKK